MDNKIPRMRTIPKAYNEIITLDPSTCFTITLLRKMVKTGDIPSVKVNNKVLVNVDLLIEKLNDYCYNSIATHIL